jgi:mono/diheme cytochrome c family protein
MTFPEGSCSVQQEWIRLGTAGWPEPTYGATNKPVGGSGAVMPAFATLLTDEQVLAVALYERVAFGGQDLEAAKVDCVGAPADGETTAAGG